MHFSPVFSSLVTLLLLSSPTLAAPSPRHHTTTQVGGNSNQGGYGGGGQGGAASTLSDADKQTILKLHNDIRASYNQAPALVWDDSTAAVAQNSANGCQLGVHDVQGTEFGQNLAWGTGTGLAGLVQLWIDEKKNYQSPVFTSGTGHFSQVVWKETTKIGCAMANCGSGGSNLVCNYLARGNVQGQFEQNAWAGGSGGAGSYTGGGNSDNGSDQLGNGNTSDQQQRSNSSPSRHYRGHHFNKM